MAQSDLKLLVNGLVMEKSRATRELFRDLVTTLNPGADTPYNALTNVHGKDGAAIPAESVIASLESSQESGDTIQIVEDGKVTGETTFGKLVTYARLCIDRDSWKPVTFGVKKAKPESGGFDW